MYRQLPLNNTADEEAQQLARDHDWERLQEQPVVEADLSIEPDDVHGVVQNIVKMRSSRISKIRRL